MKLEKGKEPVDKELVNVAVNGTKFLLLFFYFSPYIDLSSSYSLSPHDDGASDNSHSQSLLVDNSNRLQELYFIYC